LLSSRAFAARLGAAALHHRLPSIGQFTTSAQLGVLLGYGPDTAHYYQRLTAFVDKILKGAKPGELPIEGPTQFAFAINLPTATALGLTIPPSLLVRADEVIE